MRDNSIPPRLLTDIAREVTSDGEILDLIKDVKFPAVALDGTKIAEDRHETLREMRRLATKKHYQKALQLITQAPTVVSLQDDRLRKMSDGEIFNTITTGKNTMLAYGPNIVVADRWAIIAYLRALQRSQHATIADVPEDHRAEMDKPASPPPTTATPAK